MRHGMNGRKLDRPTQQRMLLYRNLVTDLLRYEKITTTQAKGKEAGALAEKMITLGKRGTLHARRQALAFITDEDVVARLFSDLAPRYAQRSGGYTRMSKLGPRLGDSSMMVRLELV